MQVIGQFVSVNTTISRAMTPRNVHEANVFGMYRKVGSMLLSHPKVTNVVDIAAGKSWHFPPHYKHWYGIHLIGLDIDAGELAENQLLDERLRCDVVERIPLEPESVDLITVHSGIEHFHDNQRFLANAFSVLRPGGFLLAQFPSRYAPFAIANRLLPRRVSRRILDLIMREDADDLGFQAFYDRTNYSAFRVMYRAAGFEEVYYLPGYYSSSYFEFFVPAYVVSYLYDACRFALGIKDLSSYNLWVLQKPNGAIDPEPFRFYAWD